MAAPEGYKALGKIGISYKGDYTPNSVYERLDVVYHNGSTYLAIKDAPDGAPRNDKINWIYLAKGYDGETVDVADSEIAFTDSETRENISSGEKVSTVFGKVKKIFTDLTAPAFAQMITTKEDLLATKVTGYVPDAKAVADTYTELNGKLQMKIEQKTGEYKNQKLNKPVTICSVTVTPGLWLIIGFIDCNISSDITYNNTIFGQTVRASMIGGGGSTNVMIRAVDTITNIDLSTYDFANVSSDTTYRGVLTAVCLKSYL